MDIIINMEPKKDISLYKTNEMVSKNQDFSSIDKGNSISKDKDKDTDINLCDFNIFINKKTKKLTTALYMVTSFLSDNEPLKWNLRECSLSLFSGVSNVRNESVSEVDNVFAGYISAIDEIVSLLEVASISKLISEMNFSILQKEYFDLKDTIISDEYIEDKYGRFVFSNEFFDNNNVLIKPQKKEVLLSSNTKRKDDFNSQVQAVESSPQSTETKSKSDFASIGHSVPKRQQSSIRHIKDKHSTSKDDEKLKDTKSERKEVIIKLLKSKKGKEFTIKDISHEVSDCSEKTIQRELVSLVSKGILKKNGERRWSRYSYK